MLETEFGEARYLEENQAIFLRWKKFCSGEDYRQPLRYLLELADQNKYTSFLIDARNGFEDEKEDAIWAIEIFIPKLAETDCKKVVFVTNQGGSLEGEIDMFTKAFQVYFEVTKVSSMEEGLACLKQ